MKEREIVKTWIAGQCSCNIIIPKNIAKQFGFDKPSYATIESSDDGILIKRLEI